MIDMPPQDAREYTLDELHEMTTREYFSIHSEAFGNGPLHERREDAEEEAADMREDDPSDTITVQVTRMTKKEYEKLPEFEGY